MKDFTFDYTLKPCPICGSEEIGTLLFNKTWLIGCLSCGVSTSELDAREAAVTKWNKLPRPADISTGKYLPVSCEKIDKAVREDERKFALHLKLLLRDCNNIPNDLLGKCVKPFMREAYIKGYQAAMKERLGCVKYEDDLK